MVVGVIPPAPMPADSIPFWIDLFLMLHFEEEIMFFQKVPVRRSVSRPGSSVKTQADVLCCQRSVQGLLPRLIRRPFANQANA